MKKSLFVGAALAGLLSLSAAPALADEPETTTVVQPAPVVVQQPAQQQSGATPVIVNNTSADTGRSRGYPGLVWGGVALWGVAYSAAAITAAAADDACDASSSMCIRRAGVLWAPVVGPFIALSGVEGKGSTTLKTLLAIDGAFQLGGVAMTVTGLMASASAGSSRRAAQAPTVMVTPSIGLTSIGLGASGTF